MHKSRERRMSLNKLQTHGETTAIKNGQLRRESIKLDSELHFLEKEHETKLREIQKTSEKETDELSQMLQRLGKKDNFNVHGDGHIHPAMFARRRSEGRLTDITDFAAKNKLDLPKEKKISRQRIDELSKPKTEKPPVDAKETKVRRKKTGSKKVNGQERMKTPMESPVSSPKPVIRGRKIPVSPHSRQNMTGMETTNSSTGEHLKTEDLNRVSSSRTRKLSTSSSSDSGVSSITTRRKNTLSLTLKSESVDSPTGSPLSSITAPLSSSPRSTYEPWNSVSTPTPRSASPTESCTTSANLSRRRRLSACSASVNMMQQREDIQRISRMSHRRGSVELPHIPFNRNRRCSRDGIEIDATSIVTKARENITRDLEKCRYLRLPEYLNPNELEVAEVFN